MPQSGKSSSAPSHVRTDHRPARGDPELQPVPLLELRLDPQREGLGLAELLQEEGAEAHLIACRLTDRSPRRLLRWLNIEAETERMEPLLRAVRRRVTARHIALVHLGPGRLLVRVSEPAPSICVATHRAGGICVACPLMTTDERESWRVILPQGTGTQAFLRDLPGGPSMSPAISRLHPYRSKTSLTRRQNRALRVAYDLGYFTYPRRGSLGDVARALGTGRSATLEVLRRATAKLAGRRFGTELRARVGP